MTVRRRHRIATVCAAGLLLVALSVTASADHSWGNYHWARTVSPFTLDLGDNVSAVWDASLATASADWSQSSVLNTVVVPGRARNKQCRPQAGRVEVCNSAYGNNGWLGIAQIWANGSHITQGSVKMNDTYFNTAQYNTPAWRALVVCQEVGHTFGLDHQDENFNNPNLGTCMDYTNNPATNQHPNAHDYAQLEAIYAHLDSSTTVGAEITRGNGAEPERDAVGGVAVAQGGDVDLNQPSEWGRLRKSGRGGRTQTFERDLGNGRRVFTFVIWAQPEE
jgi:hypothetical protein